MKKFLLLFFIGLTISSCLPEEKESSAVRVEIAGRILKVPKGYFDGAAPTGKDTESVVLEYSLPGFEVLPEHPQYKAERMELIKAGRLKGMLLEAEHKRPSFDIAVRNLMQGRDFKKEKIAYELEKYIQNFLEVKLPEQKYAPYTEDDFFIERNKDGSVKSYLRCSPPGKDKNPGCRHKFIDKGLLYSIRWRVEELPNWRQQRDAAIEFIDSLEVKLQ